MLEFKYGPGSDVARGNVYVSGRSEVAQALLESAGIPTYLENEHVIAQNWLLANAVGGFKLFVPASLENEATRILESQVSDEELAAQAESAKPPNDDPGGN